MSVKDAFTAEEWQILLRLPMKIGITLIALAPSGPIGLTKESVALAKAPFQVVQTSKTSDLISALIQDLQTQAKHLMKEEQSSLKHAQPYAYKDQTVAACQSAAAALAKASPEDETAYQQWVLAVGQKVAEAAKESGVHVSETEKTLLHEFSQALGAGAEMRANS
jgi:hypothetical protein